MKLTSLIPFFLSVTLLGQSNAEPTLAQTISWINLYANDILDQVQPKYASNGTNTAYNIRVSEDSIWFYMYQTRAISENGADRYPYFRQYYKAPTTDLIAIKEDGVIFLLLVFSETVVYHESTFWKGRGMENVKVDKDTATYKNYISIMTGDRSKEVNSERLKPLVRALNRYIALVNENSVSEDLFD